MLRTLLREPLLHFLLLGAALFGLLVFVAALIVLIMLTSVLSRSVRSSPLGKPDKILGAGFGVLCAWVAMGAAFLFYGYLGPRQLPPAVEGAASFPMIREMATFVEPYLPTGFRNRLQRPGMDSGAITALSWPKISSMPAVISARRSGASMMSSSSIFRWALTG